MKAIVYPYIYTDRKTSETRTHIVIRFYDNDGILIARTYKAQPSIEKARELLETYFPQFPVVVAPERPTDWEAE